MPRIVARSIAANDFVGGQPGADIVAAPRRGRHIAQHAPRAVLAHDLDRPGLRGMDERLILVGDAGADELLGQRVARQDDPVPIGDRHRATLGKPTLLQLPGEPSQIQRRRHDADHSAGRVPQRQRQRQDRAKGDAPFGILADDEPARLDHILEIRAIGEAQVRWRRLLPTRDAAVEIQRGDRRQIWDLGLQRGEVGDAFGRVERARRRHLGHREQEVAHAGKDLVELGGGQLRLAHGQLAQLLLTTVPQVPLVVGLDDDGGQQRDRDQDEQPLRQRHLVRFPLPQHQPWPCGRSARCTGYDRSLHEVPC